MVAPSLIETSFLAVYRFFAGLNGQWQFYLYKMNLTGTPPHLVPLELGKASASSLLSYLSSIDVDPDTVLALRIGLVAGIGVVALLAAFPGEPFDYTKLDGGVQETSEVKQKKKREEEESSSKEDGKKPTSEEEQKRQAVNEKLRAEAEKAALSLDWETDKIIKKTAKLQKLFRLSDEDMRTAIENAKLENAGQQIKSNDVDNGDARMSISAKVDFVVYSTLIILMIYFFKRDYGAGNFNRLIMRYFPKEGKALGMYGGDGQETIYRLHGGGEGGGGDGGGTGEL